MTEMMNPVADVQGEIARMLEAEPWFAAHRVEIAEQNRQQLAFLIRQNLSALNHVLLVVAVESFSNNHTALECEITVTCSEHVMSNRAVQGFTTAIDACQAAVQVIDGEWWHFIDLRHTSDQEHDLLQATATFRGLVNREFLLRMSE